MLQSRMLVDEENLNQESQDDVVGDDDGDDDDDDSPKKKGYDDTPKAAKLRKPEPKFTIRKRKNGKLRGKCPDKKIGWMEGEVKGAELKETSKRMKSEAHCIKMAFKENKGKAAGAWIRHSGKDK